MKIFAQNNKQIFALIEGAINVKNDPDKNGSIFNVGNGVKLLELVQMVKGLSADAYPAMAIYYKGGFIDQKVINEPPIYWNLKQAMDNTTASKYIVYPGDHVKILTTIEYQDLFVAQNNQQTAGTTGGAMATGSMAMSNLPYYKYQTQTLTPIGEAKFDPNLQIYDPASNTYIPAGIIYPDGTGVLPMFNIDGKIVYGEQGQTQMVIKKPVPILPRADVDKINSLVQLYINGKLTKDALLQSLAQIDSVRQTFQLRGVPIIDLASSAANLLSFIKDPANGVLNARTVSDFLTVLGVNNQASQPIVLTDPTTMVTLDGNGNEITVNVFDYNGKKYVVPQDQTTLVINEKTRYIPISQIVVLAIAAEKFLTGHTAAGFKQLLDIMPEFIDGTSNTQILDRLEYYTKMMGGNFKVDDKLVALVLQDPLMQKILMKMGASPNSFSKLQPKDALMALFLIKDAFDGSKHPLEVVQELAQIPGIANAFPKIGKTNWLTAITAVVNLGNDISKKQIVSAQDLETAVRALGIDPSKISDISLEKASAIWDIYVALKNAKNNPSLRNQAIERAVSLLPSIFPGIDNSKLLDGILNIAGSRGNLKIIISTLASNPSIRAFLEQMGLNIFEDTVDAQGHPITVIANTNISLQDAANVLQIISDLQNKKILPLQAAALIMNVPTFKEILKNQKGFVNVVEFASAIDNIMKAFREDTFISSQDLAEILKVANIDPGKLGILDPRNFIFLYQAEQLFKKGDKQGALAQVLQLLPDLMHDKVAAQAIADAAKIFLTGAKNKSTADLLIEISRDPIISQLLQALKLAPPSATTPSNYYRLPNGATYAPVNNPSTEVTGRGLVVTGIDPDNPDNVIVEDENGQTQSMAIIDAQNMGVPLNDGVGQEIAPPTSANQGSNVSFWDSLTMTDKLALVASLKDLLSGKQNIFGTIQIIKQIPGVSKLLGANEILNSITAMSQILARAGKGEPIDIEAFNEFANNLGIKITDNFTPGQAASLYAAFVSFKKGDIPGALSDILDAFPLKDNNDVIQALLKDTAELKSGNIQVIVQTIWNTPELKKWLQNQGIDLTLKIGTQELSYADALQIGSIILDACKGKIDPIVAAKMLESNKAFAAVFPKLTGTLFIATTLYDVATEFGKQPINPADIDKLFKLLNVNIDNLPLGTIIGAINGLELLFKGKWQLALEQGLMLLNVSFGGIPVGFLIQILFLVFPGLGAIFGKGGGGNDNPTEACQRCGCTVKDPGGASNDRSMKPGGRICIFCGGELKSAAAPQAIPGQPAPTYGYPFNATVNDEMPKTRTGLSTTGCDYVAAKNIDCAAFVNNPSIGPMTEANADQFSLFCRDLRAFYGEGYLGDLSLSPAGQQNEEAFKIYQQRFDQIKTEFDYRTKMGEILQDQAVQDLGSGFQQMRQSNDPQQKAAWGAIFDAWTKIKGQPTSTSFSTGIRGCGYLEGYSRDQSTPDSQCSQYAEALTAIYTGLPEEYRDQVLFKSLKVKHYDDNGNAIVKQVF